MLRRAQHDDKDVGVRQTSAQTEPFDENELVEGNLWKKQKDCK